MKNNSFIDFTFLGDISLNGNYKNYIDKDIFKDFNKIIHKDFLVGNLECMLNGKKGINPQKNLF